MDLASLNTVDNPNQSRFELKDGEKLLAFIDYKIGRTGSWYLVHTEVVAQEQRGIGQKIVRESLKILEDRNLKLVPTCPFVKAFVKKNYEEYRHLLDDRVNLED